MQKKIFLSAFLALSISTLTKAQVTSVNSGNGITVNNTNAQAPILNLGGTLNSNVNFDLGASYNFNLLKGSSNYLTLLNNGNLGIGTATPGNVLDVNGIANFRNNLTVFNPSYTGGLTLSNIGNSQATIGTSIASFMFGYNGGNYISTANTILTPALLGYQGKNLTFYGGLAAGLGGLNTNNYSYAFSASSYFINNTFSSGDFIWVNPAISSTVAGNYVHNIIDITPTINVSGSYASTIRGIFYNPTITSLTGNNPIHIAFQNTVGNNIFNSTSGNTMVGTATDNGQKLQVTGSTYFNGPLKINVTGLTGMGTATNVLVADANGNLGYTAMSNVGGSGVWAPITTGSTSQYNTNTGNILIGSSTDNGSKLQVTGTGYFSSNVVIGTTPGGSNTSPYLLAINGSAICNKLVVKPTLNWPDYVFGAGYTLQSLPELENYIIRNKHLPDVPAAAEVEKNGVNVGENQAILLQKIEELTLYVIDQNKAIQVLKDQNKKLETENIKINDLQQQLNELKKMIGNK